MVGKSRTTFVLSYFGDVLDSTLVTILVACRGFQSLLKPIGKTSNANAIENLLSEINEIGADAFLALSGYVESEELATV